MSLVGTITGAILKGTSYGNLASDILGGVFGGGGPNVANALSKQVGCTIMQSQANQARALLAKGINPCTGENVNPPSIQGTIYSRYESPAATSQPIPVYDQPVAGVGPGGVSIPAATSGAFEFTTTGLIKNVIVNGRRISRRRAAAFIKKAGVDVGARGLGLTTVQAAQLLMADMTRPRRRRGLSYRQIANARRVYRTVQNMAKSLECKTTRRSYTRRKTTCR